MSLSIETKKRMERKMTAPVSMSEASELKEQAISQTFVIHKGQTGDRLYFVTTFAKPLAKEFARSSQIALSQQYLLKYRESLSALRHNLKFIITAAKMNQVMPLKSQNSGKVEQTAIDLNYLRDEFKFNHSPLTLAQNRKKSENVAIPIDSSFNIKMVGTLKTSKLIAENLLKSVDKKLLTPEDLQVKEQIFASADNIIKLLETQKISLHAFQNEILQQNTNTIEKK